jgi:hypothetical protein
MNTAEPPNKALQLTASREIVPFLSRSVQRARRN